MAEKSFHFFNTLLGPAVTATGQHIISTAILGFEALVASNFFFDNFDELLDYINNIVKEENQYPSLDLNKSTDDVYKFLTSKCNFKISDNTESVIKSILNNLPYEKLELLYTKNNLVDLIHTIEFKTLLKPLLREDYLDSLTVPKDLKDDYEVFLEFAKYYTFYPYAYHNKIKKATTMRRKAILLSDTDSTFITLDSYVKYIQKEFYNGRELTDKENINAISAINAILTEFIKHAFWHMTKNAKVLEDDRPLVNMKNELKKLAPCNRNITV